ncbi:MAG: AI-2E family transporter [Vampirovibrionales bacterium]
MFMPTHCFQPSNTRLLGVWLVVLLLLGAIFWSHWSSLLTLAIAILLGVYILLEPVVWLEQRLFALYKSLNPTSRLTSIPLWLRAITVATVFGFLVAVVMAFLGAIGPVASAEFSNLVTQLPSDLVRLMAQGLVWLEQRVNLGSLLPVFQKTMPITREHQLTDWLWQSFFSSATRWTADHPLTGDNLSHWLNASAMHVRGWMTTLLGGVVGIVLTIMGIFYALLYRPVGLKTEQTTLLSQAHQVMRAFVRGQVVLGLITGLYMFVVYTFWGVKYALLLALLFSVVEIIPVLGTWLGIIPGLVMALLTGGPIMALGVFLCSYLYQTIKDNVVAPKIVGDVMGLHPVVVLISLVFFGKVAGVLGVIMAIPAVALAAQWWRDYVANDDKKAILTQSLQQWQSGLSQIMPLVMYVMILWSLSALLPELVLVLSIVWMCAIGWGWLIDSVEVLLTQQIITRLLSGVSQTWFQVLAARLCRVVATILVLVSLASLVLTLAIHWAPTVMLQWEGLRQNLPSLFMAGLEEVRHWPWVFKWLSNHQNVSSQVLLGQWLNSLWHPSTGLTPFLLGSSFSTLLWGLLGMVLLAYSLMDAQSMRQGFVALWHSSWPVQKSLLVVENRLKWVIPAQWLWSVVVALSTYTLFVWGHIPFAKGLATLIFLLCLWPTVGPWFAAILLFIMMSLLNQGFLLIAWVFIFSLLYWLKQHFWLPFWKNYLETISNEQHPQFLVLSPLWWVAGSALCLEALGLMGLIVIIPFTVGLATIGQLCGWQPNRS